jgi:type IV secretory pathway VirB2 component (pilin)
VNHNKPEEAQPLQVTKNKTEGEFKMSTFKRQLITSLSLALLGLVATLIIPTSAMAQSDPAENAYQVQLTSQGCFNGTGATTCALIFVIPSGKRFVLERIDGNFALPENQNIVGFFVATHLTHPGIAQTFNATHTLPRPTLDFTDGLGKGRRNHFLIYLETRFYSEVGLTVIIKRDVGSTIIVPVEISISGYLVNLPPPVAKQLTPSNNRPEAIDASRQISLPRMGVRWGLIPAER